MYCVQRKKCCYESSYQFSSDDGREKVAGRRIILRKKGGDSQDAGVGRKYKGWYSECLGADTETHDGTLFHLTTSLLLSSFLPFSFSLPCFSLRRIISTPISQFPSHI